MKVSFLRSAIVYLWSRYRTKMPVIKSAVCHGWSILSAHFFSQLSHAHKSWPTINCMSSALDCIKTTGKMHRIECFLPSFLEMSPKGYMIICHSAPKIWFALRCSCSVLVVLFSWNARSPLEEQCSHWAQGSLAFRSTGWARMHGWHLQRRQQQLWLNVLRDPIMPVVVVSWTVCQNHHPTPLLQITVGCTNL